MAARIDALLNAADPEGETAQALAREMAALTRSVEDARGSLAETAKRAARREEQASSEARLVSEGVAALDAQGMALGKLIGATGRQAEATARQVDRSARQVDEAASQVDAIAQGVAGMKKTAEALDVRLRDHAQNVSRATERLYWRPWLTGLAIAAVAFTFFAAGAVSQREIGVLSLGDPRHEWNKHVVEHFAPLLAACAAKGRLENKSVRCSLTIVPSREVAIPLHSNMALTGEAPEKLPDLRLEP